MFQADVFPDCNSGGALLTAEQFFEGANVDAPPQMSMRPGAEQKQEEKAAPVVMKSAAQLQRELDAANARIAELEKQLAAKA